MRNYYKILFFILLLTTYYTLHTGLVHASFFERIINLFTTVSQGPIQISFRFFVSHDTLDPWDPWPPGSSLDLLENSYLSPMSFPPLPGQMFRLRIGIKATSDWPDSNRKLKLQFGKLTTGQTSCSTITTWNDLGNPGTASDWRGFDMSMAQLANGTQITANKLAGATVKGSYQESNPTPFNPLVLKDQIIEYDWSIQNNIVSSSLDGGFYCFRMVNQNGSVLNQYLQYPKVASTKPPVCSTSSTIDKNLGGSMNCNNANGTSFIFTAPTNYLPTSHSFDINSFNSSDFLDLVGGQPSGKVGAHSYIYQMNAERNNTATSSFEQNLTMRIDYSDSEISSVDESSLRIYKHDGNDWSALTTSLDQNNNKATANVNSFSSFGLFGDTATPTPTPTATPTPASGGGGGGGGGGGYVQTAPPASVVIKGKSYPNSTISFLRDAQLISKTKADKLGNFEITESGLSGGGYNFSLWALDELNLRSNIYSFFLNIIANSTNNVLGVLMPPTITLNKTTINPGEKIRVYGSSVPESFVIIEVRSEPMILSTKASDKGLYSDEILSSKLARGIHTVKSKSKIGTGDESIFSSLLNFGIGVPAKKALIGDLNKDGKVNIIDFSILAFWYKKTGFPADFDLKQDGKIDLKDFSIMAFYWTG